MVLLQLILPPVKLTN